MEKGLFRLFRIPDESYFFSFTFLFRLLFARIKERKIRDGFKSIININNAIEFRKRKKKRFNAFRNVLFEEIKACDRFD